MKNLNLKKMNLPKQLWYNQTSGKRQKNIPKKLNFQLVFIFIISFYFNNIFLKASKSKAYAQLSIGKGPKKERRKAPTFSIEFK